MHTSRVFLRFIVTCVLITYNNKHMQTKNERIANAKLMINGAKYSIEQCDELLNALATHTGKLIDKRFFEKHFTQPDNGFGRVWTKYSLHGKRYEWETDYNHRITLQRYVHTEKVKDRDYSTSTYSDYETIELVTRETAHVIERVQAKKQAMNERIAHYTEQLAQLETVDNSAIVKDLLAVYAKHNAPITWLEVLDMYEVKYPKN